MPDNHELIWSNTDFPYMCLKDEHRTNAFKKVIESSIKPGDVVVDIGSGSGILAFFAAASGADKVFAVEIEHTLSEALRASVKANGLTDKVEVIEADIMNAELPSNVDVVISEIMETGLIDELQVPAINSLRSRGIIGENTLIIPHGYETYVDLVSTDNLYYGYKIFAPKHEWPFYSNEENGWYQSVIEPVSERILINKVDFSDYIEPRVTYGADIRLTDKSKPVTALRMSGLVLLDANANLGSTNALNGDKIFPLTYEVAVGREDMHVEISYEMGLGFSSLIYTCAQP